MAPSKDVTADDKPIKIDKWDGSALKNTLDDGVKKVLVDVNGLTESHSLMDGRLLICTIAIAFAMFALVWDFFNPFPLSRDVLMICVISYFVLMGVLTIYMSYVEKGIFLIALEKDRAMMEPDNKWIASSSLRKFDDTYHLTMTFTDGKTKQDRVQCISRCVAEYFDENGLFCSDLFSPVVQKMIDELANMPISKKKQ